MSSPADDAKKEVMMGGEEKKKTNSHNNALILAQQYFKQPSPLSYEHAACFRETYLTRLRLPPCIFADEIFRATGGLIPMLQNQIGI